MASVYALLSEFPGATHVASAHLTRLTNLLKVASKGRYGKETAILFRDTARNSIGSNMPAKSLELTHTIRLIQELDSEIAEIENAIQTIMDKLNPPILSDKLRCDIERTCLVFFPFIFVISYPVGAGVLKKVNHKNLQSVNLYNVI